jgi:hypothetical protein
MFEERVASSDFNKPSEIQLTLMMVGENKFFLPCSASLKEAACLMGQHH